MPDIEAIRPVRSEDAAVLDMNKLPWIYKYRYISIWTV